MSDFQDTKLWLLDLVGLAKDALHIYVGLAVFLLVAALFRLPLRDWRPLAAVLAVAVAGEAWDLVDTRASGDPIDWGSGWHDLANTLFWLFVLFALARWTGLLSRQA